MLAKYNYVQTWSRASPAACLSHIVEKCSHFLIISHHFFYSSPSGYDGFHQERRTENVMGFICGGRCRREMYVWC
jgi:hypothetical protein